MLERAGIAFAIGLVGFAAYQVGTRLQVGRVARYDATDPILAMLRPSIAGIVYFWSDDCPPCKTVQKPALAALQLELGEDRLQVLAINVYEQPELAEAWGVLSLPTTFVVDANGEPRGVNHGVARVDKLRRQVLALR